MTTDAAISRRLDFAAGVFNARDLGGLPTAGGGEFVRGLVYRADGLHRLQPADIERLAAVGVRTIVDLRTSSELAEAASVEGNGITVLHLPILREVWPHASFTDEETANASTFLAARYVEMLDEGRDAIRRVFELLADEQARPLAFHCSAGKDRTGVVAALVLGLLDVTDEVIAADYAATAEAMERIVAGILERRGESVTPTSGSVKAIMSCPAEAMHLFLDHIRSTWGSVDGYLAEIGVRPATVAAVREVLTSP